ncbi:hypothetical protein MKX03_019331 [Papaver bracteatum]|nr:hypothetical protein MKX03_019331 [Papaver bracteatum]
MDFHNQAMKKIKEIDILELLKEHGKDMPVESEVNDELLATVSSCTTVAEIPNAFSFCTNRYPLTLNRIISDTFDATLPNMIMGDPRISQTKGRNPGKGKGNAPTDSRFKSGMEISKEGKKPRMCKYCTLTGHDSCNFEKKKADQLRANNSNGM